jgi:hypothetical protein
MAFSTCSSRATASTESQLAEAVLGAPLRFMVPMRDFGIVGPINPFSGARLSHPQRMRNLRSAEKFERSGHAGLQRLRQPRSGLRAQCANRFRRGLFSGGAFMVARVTRTNL